MRAKCRELVKVKIHLTCEKLQKALPPLCGAEIYDSKRGGCLFPVSLLREVFVGEEALASVFVSAGCRWRH